MRILGGKKEDEPPEPADPEATPPTTTIVPTVPVQVHVENKAPPPFLPIPGVGPSFEADFRQVTHNIEVEFQRGAWRYEVNAVERKKLLAEEKRVYRALCAWTRDTALMDSMLHEMRTYEERHFEADAIDWLYSRIEHELHKRHLRFREGGTVDSGVDSRKLRERFGILQNADEPESKAPDLLEVVAMMKDEVAQGYDILAVIGTRSGDVRGGVGSGKSDFAQVLAVLLDDTYDLRHRTVFYKDVERLKVMMSLRFRKIAWVVDEAEWFAYRQDWAGKEQRELIKEFMSRRFLGQAVILCIPFVWYIDEKLQDRVTWYFEVQERGVIQVWRGVDKLIPNGPERFHQKLITTIRVGPMPPPNRRVYDAVKDYAFAHEPGALGRFLHAHKNWPYGELGYVAPEVGLPEPPPAYAPIEPLEPLPPAPPAA